MTKKGWVGKREGGGFFPPIFFGLGSRADTSGLGLERWEVRRKSLFGWQMRGLTRERRGARSDYSAGTIWGYGDGDGRLREEVNERMDG